MRPVQYFSDAYLDECRKLTPAQIVRFLDDFRRIGTAAAVSRKKSRLISMKVPEDLLQAFRRKASLNGLRYQTQIKALMQAWVIGHAERDT